MRKSLAFRAAAPEKLFVGFVYFAVFSGASGSQSVARSENSQPQNFWR